MKTYSTIMLALLFACILSSTSGTQSVDAASTLLYINPTTKFVTPGTTFTVDIDVSDVELLYYWQVNITYDPSVLRCVGVTEGDFLAGQPEGTFGPSPIIRTSWALFGWTTLGAYVGVSGSGTLATLEFEVLARGESLIEFAQIGVRTFLVAQTSPNPPPNFVDLVFATEDGLVIPETTINLSGVEGQNDWFTSDVTVTLSAWSAGVEKTEYSFENVTWNTYAVPFTVDNQGHFTIHYRSIDTHGNPEPTKTETMKIDKTPPTGAITINDNAMGTTSAMVVLTLSVTDATSGLAEMRCSNDNVTYTDWEPYAPSKPWTLPGEEGTKTVYMQFRDNSGLVSTISDTIILDTTPPNIQINSPSWSLEVKSSSVAAVWSASDATALHTCLVRLDSGSWIDVGLNMSHTFTGLADGSHRIEVRVTDMVGLSDENTVEFIVNTSPLLGPGYVEEAVIGGIAVIAILGIAVYLLRLRR